MQTQQPSPAEIGPTIGYNLSRCERGGGYIVWVDGQIHAACTTLQEAMAIMHGIAAAQYRDDGTRLIGDPPPMPPGPAEAPPRVLSKPREASGSDVVGQVKATVVAALMLGVATAGRWAGA